MSLRSIEIINISNIGEYAGSAFYVLCKKLSSGLLTLKLSSVEFQESDIKYISTGFTQLINLEQLSLNEFNLNNTSAIELFNGLKYLSNIKFLNLERMNIDFNLSEKVFESLSQLNSLVELDLSNNPIKSKAFGVIKVLESNEGLKILKLNNCSIDDSDFEKMLPLFNSISSVEIIEMNENSITIEAATFFKDLFSEESKIKEVYLLKNKITYKDVKPYLSSKDNKKLIME